MAGVTQRMGPGWPPPGVSTLEPGWLGVRVTHRKKVHGTGLVPPWCEDTGAGLARGCDLHQYAPGTGLVPPWCEAQEPGWLGVTVDAEQCMKYD